MSSGLVPGPSMAVHDAALLQGSGAIRVGDFGVALCSQPVYDGVHVVFRCFLVSQSSVSLCYGAPFLVLWNATAVVSGSGPLFARHRTALF